MSFAERQLAIGTIWYLLGTVLAQAVALCASILIARVLGLQEFGELSIVRMTILMVASFVGGGLSIAAAKHTAELREQHPDQAGAVIGLLLAVALTLSSFGAVVVLAMSTWFADFLLHAESVAGTLRIGVLILVTSTVSSVQNGVLQGTASFRCVAWTSIVEALFMLVFGIAGALTMAVNGAMLGFGAAALAMVALRHHLLQGQLRQQRITITYKEWRTNLKLLKSVALPSMLLTAVIQPAEWLGRVVIARGPDGLSQVAIFTAAQSIATITQLAPAQLANASLPVMTEIQSRGSDAVFRRTVFRTTISVLFGGMLVAGVLMVASKTLMGLYGESFSTHSDVLVVLAATYGVAVTTMVWGSALIAKGHTWSQLAQKCCWTISMLGVAYLLADKGAWGLAIAYAVGNAVLISIQLVAVRSVLRVQQTNKPFSSASITT